MVQVRSTCRILQRFGLARTNFSPPAVAGLGRFGLWLGWSRKSHLACLRLNNLLDHDVPLHDEVMR